MYSNLILDNNSLRKDFIAYLADCIYERRVSQIQKVLENRTRYVTVVLEDIFQSQNASAVIRTSECLGVQDLYIIENKHSFNINPKVVLGSSKWLNINKFNGDTNNSIKAIESLKSKGYRIVATSPHSKGVSLEQLDLQKGKLALFFGTELTGLSKTVLKNADEFVSIPMYGFTESYNISVSAALVLYSIMKRLRASDIQYLLGEVEREKLLLLWLQKSTKNWEMMEKRFVQEKNIEAYIKY